MFIPKKINEMKGSYYTFLILLKVGITKRKKSHLI